MTDDHGERWRPVRDYEGLYKVSDRGKVRSLDRQAIVQMPGGYRVASGRITRRHRGRTLKWRIRTDGYPDVVLSRDGIETAFMVHLLVLEAFVSRRPPGQEARHGPAGKADPSLANLCWGTRSENTGPDRVRDGQSNRGERHGIAVLTEKIVTDVRQRVAAGERQVDLAAEYGVSKQLVWEVVHRRSWAWL